MGCGRMVIEDVLQEVTIQITNIRLGTVLNLQVEGSFNELISFRDLLVDLDISECNLLPMSWIHASDKYSQAVH